VRFARALPIATERDPFVRRAFHRTWHLLDPPETLWGSGEVRARVEAVAAAVGDPGYAPPDHQAMVRLLAQR
jgi:hypothetical protein